MTWDITSQLALNLGERYFKSDNTLVGFFGYSLGYSSGGSGVSKCAAPFVIRVRGTPCTNLDKRITETGTVPRVNFTYKLTPDKMVYATYSKGFRPGGVNRTAQAGVGPYAADFLTNYELGWKTQWLGHRVRWNGSLFWEDWKNFQFSFLGVSSVTIIENGGNARIKGIESELEWAVNANLTLSANATLIDPRLLQNYCGFTDPNGQPVTTSNCLFAGEDPTKAFTPKAPAGANMPIAPKFKGNLIARYSFDLGGWDADVQGAFVYQTMTAPALKTADQQSIGMQPAYGLFDLSAGIQRNGMNLQLLVTNVTDKRAQISRFEACTVGICNTPYVIPQQPRTIGIRFGQKF